MGRVIVFGFGGLVLIGLITLAIIMIGGFAPKIASFFWRKKKVNKEERSEIQNPFSDARWRSPDEHDRL